MNGKKEPSLLRTHNARRTVTLLALATLLTCCSSSQAQPTDTAQAGPRFVVQFTPGPAYRHSMKVLVFDVPAYPQIACWIETLDGTFVSTVYVTSKAASKSWQSAPVGGRPEALPVWQHATTARPDVVSGATSSDAAPRRSGTALGLTSGVYVAKLEVNNSYDYNDHYTKASSGVNGQPSLIYSCPIAVGTEDAVGVFEPLGTGSVDGSDGDIRPGTEGLTSALQILTSARIEYHAR